MFVWLISNAATLVIGAVLIVAVIAATRYVYKGAKSGKCAGCNGGCGGCEGRSDCGAK